MTVVAQPLTNSAYGFPSRGSTRRVRPVALACVHITGNSRTAAMPDPHAGARAERDYANRAGSNGPSATHYVARDGWAIEAIDWRRHAAWSNGDVASPSTANAGIRRLLALTAKGYNANEGYWLEPEAVGYGSSWPVTPAQAEAIASLVAAAAALSGLPISRETVHGHWEVNGVDRRNCPCPPAQHEALLGRIVARAIVLAGQQQQPGGDMGLSINLAVTHDANPWDALGTARVSGTGKAITFVGDGSRLGVASGLDLGVVQRGTMGATPVVALNYAGRLAVIPLADVSLAPVRPPADASPFTQADLDAARAEGFAAAKAAAARAVGGI